MDCFEWLLNQCKIDGMVSNHLSNYNLHHFKNIIEDHLWPDFGKPTKLSQMEFQEKPILSIEAAMVISC